jgi:DNA primase
MKSLELPANPDQLILAADGDTAGLSAAQDLGERAARRGWEVILMQAPEGNDWNDILMEQQNA